MRRVLCLVLLISLLIVIELCESVDHSESTEKTRERDSHEVDSVDADVWLCRDKRGNQLCDGGEGRCVWARRARRMICMDIGNNKDDGRESKED